MTDFDFAKVGDTKVFFANMAVNDLEYHKYMSRYQIKYDMFAPSGCLQ